ncbi:hypothetical protein NOGI109294_04135 [Nocardiopsis gilva]|nr:hypothetical protein [Nocardiopsis gilva]
MYQPGLAQITDLEKSEKKHASGEGPAPAAAPTPAATAPDEDDDARAVR